MQHVMDVRSRHDVQRRDMATFGPTLTANSLREWLMTFEAVIARFEEQSPLTVMARLTVQRVLDPAWLDALFETERQRQYTRELLFSSVIDLMAEVALGLKPSVDAAARKRQLPISVTALYDKIKRTEPEGIRALVRSGAERLSPVLDPLLPNRAPWVPGDEVRIVDGNHLAASEKRLRGIRHFRGAALPGQSVVVLAPDRDLVVDLLPCEDAHRQERAIVPPCWSRRSRGSCGSWTATSPPGPCCSRCTSAARRFSCASMRAIRTRRRSPLFNGLGRPRRGKCLSNAFRCEMRTARN